MSALRDYVQELLQVERDLSELRTQKLELEELITSNMEKPSMVLDGIGMVERRRKTVRKQWKHDELYSAINRMLPEIPNKTEVDLATGEMFTETDAQKGLRVLFELANPTWRSGALRNYGIDADEYCEATPNGYSVVITEGIEAA